MKIYHISQSDKTGFGTYDSAVVIAEDDYQAQKMHPMYGLDWTDFRHGWAYSPDMVKVTYLGEAASNENFPRVVCASFNAG